MDHRARTEIIAQLCNLTVYTSEEVKVRWLVKMKNGEVLGRADSGRVKITHKGKTMSIFLRQKDADVGHTPLELREHLTKFCGFEEAGKIRLLDFILSEHDLDEIDNELSRRGYPRAVPEFDGISLDTGNLSDLLRTKPSKRAIESRRQFCGRKPIVKRTQIRKAATSNQPDTVQSFLKKFNMANTFQDRLSRPWAEAEGDAMLAHLCRLENIDPWMLLPQEQSDWNSFLRSRDYVPGTITGVHWNTERNIHNKGHPLNTSNSFPATIYQDNQRNLRINVSTAVQNTVGEDTLFSAELYVGNPCT